MYWMCLYILWSCIVILLSVVCPGYRAGQGGREEGLYSAEPTPEHPHLPGGREGQPCWHHCGLLHALALQTGLTCTQQISYTKRHSVHRFWQFFQRHMTSVVILEMLSRRPLHLSVPHRSLSLLSVSLTPTWLAGSSPVSTSPSSRLFLERSSCVKRWPSLMVSHQHILSTQAAAGSM